MVIVEVQQILVHQTHKLSCSSGEFTERLDLTNYLISPGERNAAILWLRRGGGGRRNRPTFCTETPP
jgi:hypothetical protein